MAAGARCLTDIEGVLVIKDASSPYVGRSVDIAKALTKYGCVTVDALQQPPPQIGYNIKANFKGLTGTLYARENRKIHFEVYTPYEIEYVEGTFLSKRVERREFPAYITGITPLTFDSLRELRIKGNKIFFDYKGGERVKDFKLVFELPEARAFIKELYDWSGRKGINLPKLTDDDLGDLEARQKAAAIPEIKIEDELARLVDMRDKGIITPEEYEASKNRLLQQVGEVKAEIEKEKFAEWLEKEVTPKKPQQPLPPPPPIPPPPPPPKKCPICDEQLVLLNNKWYCKRCKL